MFIVLLYYSHHVHPFIHRLPNLRKYMLCFNAQQLMIMDNHNVPINTFINNQNFTEANNLTNLLGNDDATEEITKVKLSPYCIVLYCIILYYIMRPYTDGPIGPLSYRHSWELSEIRTQPWLSEGSLTCDPSWTWMSSYPEEYSTSNDISYQALRQ